MLKTIGNMQAGLQAICDGLPRALFAGIHETENTWDGLDPGDPFTDEAKTWAREWLGEMDARAVEKNLDDADVDLAFANLLRMLPVAALYASRRVVDRMSLRSRSVAHPLPPYCDVEFMEDVREFVTGPTILC